MLNLYVPSYLPAGPPAGLFALFLPIVGSGLFRKPPEKDILKPYSVSFSPFFSAKDTLKG